MMTLTEEVFWCCQVTPFLFEYAGLPYIVPYGTDLMGAKTILPREVFEAPNVDNQSTVEKVTKSNKKGGLDAWL